MSACHWIFIWRTLGKSEWQPGRVRVRRTSTDEAVHVQVQVHVDADADADDDGVSCLIIEFAAHKMLAPTYGLQQGGSWENTPPDKQIVPSDC